jgi:hypothetical protein
VLCTFLSIQETAFSDQIFLRAASFDLGYNSRHSWRDGSHIWLTLNKHRKTKKRKRTLAAALASRAGGLCR